MLILPISKFSWKLRCVTDWQGERHLLFGACWGSSNKYWGREQACPACPTFVGCNCRHSNPWQNLVRDHNLTRLELQSTQCCSLFEFFVVHFWGDTQLLEQGLIFDPVGRIWTNKMLCCDYFKPCFACLHHFCIFLLHVKGKPDLKVIFAYPNVKFCMNISADIFLSAWWGVIQMSDSSAAPPASYLPCSDMKARFGLCLRELIKTWGWKMLT